MDLDSESIYLRSIDKIIDKMKINMSDELKSLVSITWKNNLKRLVRNSKTHKKQNIKEATMIKTQQENNKIIKEPDLIESLTQTEYDQDIKDSDLSEPLSDDEYLLPECKNICFGKLKKLKRTQNLWTFRLSGCSIKFENGKELVLPHIAAQVRSEFSI